jgi:hypothetical protein
MDGVKWRVSLEGFPMEKVHPDIFIGGGPLESVPGRGAIELIP